MEKSANVERSARRSRSRSRDRKDKHRKRRHSRERSSKHKHRHRDRRDHKHTSRRRSRSSSRTSLSSRSSSDRSRRERLTEVTAAKKWRPDFNKGRDILKMLLKAKPEVGQDLIAVMASLDAGNCVDLSAVEDVFVKTGLKAVFLALELDEDRDVFSIPSHGQHKLEEWFTHMRIEEEPLAVSHDAGARVMGPTRRPDAALTGSERAGETDSDEDIGPHLPGDARARQPTIQNEEVVHQPTVAKSREGWMDALADGIFGEKEKKVLPRRLQMARHNPETAAAAQTEDPKKSASLFDMCQQQAKADAPTKAAYRPFDRERDLQIRRPVDASKMVANMGTLDKRFSTTGSYSSSSYR